MNEQYRELEELAAWYGMQYEYRDGTGVLRRPSAEGVLHVLHALGAPVSGMVDVGGALRQKRLEHWRRVLEPVILSWDGAPPRAALRLPHERAQGRFLARLSLEDGRVLEHAGELGELPIELETELEGARFIKRTVVMPGAVPLGYHRFAVQLHGTQYDAQVIAAPTHVPRAETGTWGVFAPTYALRTTRSSGAGDLADLDRLVEHTKALGGGMVGTLPLFATSAQDPSPYAPISRMFWNELFLAPEWLPELEDCPQARALLGAREHRERAASLGASRLVDYEAERALRTPVLQALARCAFRDGDARGTREGERQRYLQEQPLAEDYARFRAVTEARGQSWREWPQRLREQGPGAEDYDEAAFHYHLYVQWRMEEQLRGIGERAATDATGLYLDLPLGVSPHGYDAWRYRDRFVQGCSVGAPPDGFFAAGQSWGFEPLHPEAIREGGYDYVQRCLRRSMQHAGLLRIDHVMGMHRMFYVPEGMSATEGMYVHYRPEELYGLLCLEASRQGTAVVGEDLGTVPQEVRESMRQHDLLRMYVMQFEVDPARSPVVRLPEGGQLASLNTHDLPPFSAFLRGHDVDDRVQLGHVDVTTADRERKERESWRRALANAVSVDVSDELALLRASLEWMARSAAEIVLVTLEDLWQETQPQNVPGTGAERPNWRRRIRYPLEEAFHRPEIIETLRMVDVRRRGL